jgi:MFS family permease
MSSLGSLEVTALYLTSFLAFALFLFVEPRTAAPILDLRLFKNRLFSAGNVSQFLFSLGFGSTSLIIILYFQLIRGYDALTAGILFLPLDVAFVSIGPISGKLSDRYGTRGLATLGMGVGVAGYVFLALFLTATTPLELIEVILVMLGLGVGLFSSPNISSIMGSVPPQRRGVASAIRATLFNTGNVVSVGLVAYIITTVIPYGVVSGIITGGYTTLTPTDSSGFIAGVGRAFAVAAVITVIGMFASSLRGHENKNADAQAMSVTS